MTADAPSFLSVLQDRATAAQAEEIRFRKSIAAEIEAREKARAYAFRRLGLMRAITAAAAAAENLEAARAAQLRTLTDELGWDGAAEAPGRALAAFTPVADAVWRALNPAPEGEEVSPGPDPVEAFAIFEAWYAGAFGRPFLAILDQEPLEIPVVEC